jgi:hypothetical protein
VTEPHLVARLDGQRGDTLGLDLGDEFCDAAGDLDAVLVELALPEQAGENGTTQLQFVRDVTRGRALVGAQSVSEIQQVESGHFSLQSSVVSLQLRADRC